MQCGSWIVLAAGGDAGVARAKQLKVDGIRADANEVYIKF